MCYDIEKFYATLAKTPCGQYVHGVKQTLTDKQKKRLLSSTSIHEVHTLLKTAFSYAVEWDLIHKIPLPRDAPKVNIEERTIWDEKTMLAALQTIENPALHLAVHMSMILSLREGEILGLQPSDLDFDAADGRGTISVSKTMQRANKDALEKLDPNQVYHTFPDRREGSKSSLILKKPKTKKSNRVLYMTKPLKEELLAWLEKLKQDEQNAPEKYSNCGQLFRLPDGLPIAPELLTKWYRLWRAEHPEFEQIVFHGLRHSSATYQLLQSDGDFKSVQGNTGHATASVLMDTYRSASSFAVYSSLCPALRRSVNLSARMSSSLSTISSTKFTSPHLLMWHFQNQIVRRERSNALMSSALTLYSFPILIAPSFFLRIHSHTVMI